MSTAQMLELNTAYRNSDSYNCISVCINPAELEYLETQIAELHKVMLAATGRRDIVGKVAGNNNFTTGMQLTLGMLADDLTEACYEHSGSTCDLPRDAARRFINLYFPTDGANCHYGSYLEEHF